MKLPTIFLAGALVCADPAAGAATPPTIAVHTDFPGGSAEVNEIDSAKRLVRISPKEHKNRGWVCWWYCRLSGLVPNEKITFEVSAPSGFARPDQATISTDGKTWQHSEPGSRIDKQAIAYSLTATSAEMWVAWGPTFNLADANELVERIAGGDSGAKAFELCRSKEGRKVPGLLWEPAPKEGQKCRGVWISARQHAWESGGSWVCRGIVEWIASNDPQAKLLRQRARVVVVPIMDVDNVERGAGGKEQKPHDHNRDWSDEPVWPEVAAAQKLISKWNADGEFDLFQDLHNPAPDDRQAYFCSSERDKMPEIRRKNAERFFALGAKQLIHEPIRLKTEIQENGPTYHKLWRQISNHWVDEHTREAAIAITLETPWNTPHSTQEGYMNYGRALGRAIAEYVLGPPDAPK